MADNMNLQDNSKTVSSTDIGSGVQLINFKASVPASSATGSITAQNTFTTATTFAGQSYFCASVSGTWSATVTLQKSYDGSTWLDQTSWTANTESIVFNAAASAQWRIGVKTGGFTSGTVVLRLAQ